MVAEGAAVANVVSGLLGDDRLEVALRLRRCVRPAKRLLAQVDAQGEMLVRTAPCDLLLVLVALATRDRTFGPGAPCMSGA
jgi:hypothetical protein